jgi:hypothetical protein
MKSRFFPRARALTRLTPMARALSLTVVAGLASPLQAAQPSFPIGIVQSLASVATQASGTSYVLIRTGSQRSAQAGMELVYNYGAVQLWKASGSALMKLAATSDALVQKTTLDVPSGEFDPLVSGRKDTGGSFGPQVYLVQFVGPAPDEWLDQVRATGVTPIQYVNNNAWQVLAKSDATKSSLAKLSAPWLRYSGRMTADQKIATSLNAALAEGRDDIHAVVVLADHVAVDISKQAIEALVASHGEWYGLGEGQIALEFHADEQSIRNIAELGDVLTVGLHGERRKNDEVQTQIMAGHLVSNNTLPSGTGYLGWLTGLGFSTDPADYPIIAVADDGIGDGTTTNGAGDFRLRENGNGASRITYAVSCNDTNTAAHRAGVGGHGHLNSTIAVGYDQNSGWPYHDANGYLRGQGVNPFGRVANFEIFNDSGKTNCGSDDAGVVAAEAAQNAKISSNSWGYCANANCTAPLTTYDASARAYDLGVRDANGTAAGSPSMIVVFAAGNDGSGANTVGTPGTAKNVITVGASENVRPASDNSSGGSVTWTDGCGIGASGANSAMDVISFSSRGPSTGGRKKPEVIAPGTHVQGSRSPYSGFDGSGVCDSAMPPGQTSLAASSGTSHSTPAVAGAASLVYRYLQTQYGLSDPSPALVKGYFIAHPTYLTGTGANDTLPSNTQGYGMTNLDAAFDPDTPPPPWPIPPSRCASRWSGPTRRARPTPPTRKSTTWIWPLPWVARPTRAIVSVVSGAPPAAVPMRPTITRPCSCRRAPPVRSPSTSPPPPSMVTAYLATPMPPIRTLRWCAATARKKPASTFPCRPRKRRFARARRRSSRWTWVRSTGLPETSHSM